MIIENIWITKFDFIELSFVSIISQGPFSCDFNFLLYFIIWVSNVR